MELLRTPEDRFADLPGHPFAPHYAEVGGVRLHYVDEGPRDGHVVVLLHGEPSWSYLYRTVIPPLVAAGHRAVAPDLVGFGRSDKPAAVAAHTYAAHVDWVGGLLAALDLRDITLVCQDWGGMIGLRLVAEQPERFAAVVAANTGLPTGDQAMPDVWWRFREFVERTDDLPIGFLVASGCVRPPAPAVVAAYDAPFPDASYKAGPKALPLLLPTSPDDPAAAANRAAWAALAAWEKPFLCAFSDSDPITGAMAPILRRVVPGARDLDHPTIAGAGHFLQEDAGPQLAAAVLGLLDQVWAAPPRA